MANKVRDAHQRLWALVEATFPDASRHRNPAGPRAPTAKAGGLAQYVSLTDDNMPDIVGVMCGPVYDLKATPELTFAFSGKTKDERQEAAYAQVELLKAAIAADRQLSGAVSYCDIAGVQPTDVADSDWMAGGLYVQVGLLLDAPTPAG
jgi:hypothetical protein